MLWLVIVEEGAGGGKGICYKMHRISMGGGYGANLKWEWPRGGSHGGEEAAMAGGMTKEVREGGVVVAEEVSGGGGGGGGRGSHGQRGR